jgi:hypothetical protein
VIGLPSLPHKQVRIITEWKALQIDFLDISLAKEGEDVRLRKAETLSNMTVDQVLGIKFARYDHHPSGKSIKEWVEGKAQVGSKESPAEQLKRYLSDLVVEGIRAYLIVVVGSRKILIWEMDVEKKTQMEPCLADWKFDRQ